MLCVSRARGEILFRHPINRGLSQNDNVRQASVPLRPRSSRRSKRLDRRLDREHIPHLPSAAHPADLRKFSNQVRRIQLAIVLGSQALACTIDTLEKRLADFRTQTDVARSTDFD